MNRVVRRTTAGLSLAMTLWNVPSTAERITTIDGKTFEGAVASIDADRLTLTNAAEPSLTVTDLWRIDGSTVTPPPTGMTERVILDQGDIPARGVTLVDGICRFSWAGGSDVAVTQTAVRAILFATGTNTALAEATARVVEQTTPMDRVVAVGQDNVVLTIEGSVKTVGASVIELQYHNKDRTLSRTKVGAAVFGRTESTNRIMRLLPWKATIAGGARLEATEVRLVDGVLNMTIGAASLTVPWTAVSMLEYRGSKVCFLSQLNPVRAVEGAIVALALPWQRDRSAMNKPLLLRGDVHASGLGTHAPSELVFELPEGAQNFMALVGLDEEYGKAGDCEIVILVDDREAFRRRLRGGDGAIPVDIDIRRGRRLTLRAEPGENLDLGDHVNWYDARLLFAP